MSVFVIDKNKKPLDPCCEARARILLSKGRAAVFRRYPFTIIMKDRLVEDSVVKEHRVKFDPGSKVTGLAVLQEDKKVVFAAEIEHRGWLVKKKISNRQILRKNRRSRKTRYRSCRYLNRSSSRRKSRFAPSLESRMSNVLTWVNRIRKFCPVTAISVEIAKFDTQKIQNFELKGIEYQQGTLQGYEIKQYLLEKWNYKCAYCNKGDSPLQIEHVLAKSKSGSNRVSNLVVSCKKCNQKKGTKSIEEFLKKKPELLIKINGQMEVSLKDASAVNSIRKEIYRRLCLLGLPVEIGYGYQTKWNREQLGFPKEHWIDAVCVGVLVSTKLSMKGIEPLRIKAMGYGNRQMCGTNKYGFPIKHRVRCKVRNGFRTGDVVEAKTLSGKHIGFYRGRVTLRNIGHHFDLCGVGIRMDFMKLLHKVDGYSYSC